MSGVFDHWEIREADADPWGGKPGTNHTMVGPDARKKLAPLVAHYMKKSHPFTACVADNTGRFGKERAEKVCAVLKDIGKGTTKWRKGGDVKEADVEAAVEALLGEGLLETEDHVDFLGAYLLEAAEDDADALREEWSDAARKAAIEARKRKGGKGIADDKRIGGPAAFASTKDAWKARSDHQAKLNAERARPRTKAEARATTKGLIDEIYGPGADSSKKFAAAERKLAKHAETLTDDEFMSLSGKEQAVVMGVAKQEDHDRFAALNRARRAAKK